MDLEAFLEEIRASEEEDQVTTVVAINQVTMEEEEATGAKEEASLVD